MQEDDLVRKFEELEPAEKAECQAKVNAILRDRVKNGMGVTMHTRIAIIEVMANYFLNKSGQALASICDPQLVKENQPTPWGSWAGDRCVLIGDYSDDIPPFVTAEEKSEIEKFGE